MKLSITSWSFTALTLAEANGVARALGIGHLDVGLLHAPALDRAAVLADPGREADRLRKADVAVSNVYWLFGDTPRIRPLSDRSLRDEQHGEFDAVVRFAAALESPTIFVLPGVQAHGQRRSEAIDDAVETLRPMAERAAEAGVTLTVEPHVGGLIDTPDTALEYVERVEGLKLTLDYAHFACMGFTQDRIDPLAEHAAHVHLRQARPGALQAKWAEGTIDFARVLDALAEGGHDGFVSIEYVHQDYMDTVYEDVLTETVTMRDFVRAHLAGRSDAA